MTEATGRIRWDTAELIASQSLTEAYIRSAGYRGYDPFDGLMSPIFRHGPLRRARLARWGFQQVIKRLPFQLRPILGIAPGYNPVTLALCLKAYVFRDQAEGTRGRGEEAARLIGELARLSSPGRSGPCWGYDFDWEARFASIPAWSPTVVATGFVTDALFTAWRYYGFGPARELVLGAAEFVLNDLNRTYDGDTFCWSYSPGDRQQVLNATMKGARLLAQAVAMGGDPKWLAEARAGIRFVVARQSAAGSWPYAVGDSRGWADHFHTCYNLDCLHEFTQLTGDTSFGPALERGLAYYRENYFASDGAPKYYDTRLYPIDATCCGQALLTLLRFGALDQAVATARWTLAHVRRGDGTYTYQIHRSFENRICYLRWSVAWVFLGLARLEAALAAGREIP